MHATNWFQRSRLDGFHPSHLTLQRSLATELQGLSVELRKKQSAYLKRLKQLKEVGLNSPHGYHIEESFHKRHSFVKCL